MAVIENMLFYFCLRLYGNRAQMTSWHAKNKKVQHEAKSSALGFCSSHAMTSSVIYNSTEARKTEVYLFYVIKELNKRGQDSQNYFSQVYYTII